MFTLGDIILNVTSNEPFNVFFSLVSAFGALSFGIAAVVKVLSRS
jgi:hypothetical protein